MSSQRYRRAAGDAGLHEPHVPRLPLLVRLAAAAGDEDPVAVGRVRDVGPAEGAHLVPPHPGHEEESRDHGVEPAALEGDLVGLDAAAAGAATARPARADHLFITADPNRRGRRAVRPARV